MRTMTISRKRKRMMKMKLNEADKLVCHGVLEDLMDHRFGWVFSVPVEPVVLEIPDYFDFVWNPMDLGTVKSKLEKDVYAIVEEFARDVRLTFSNARKYNPPSNAIHRMANEMANVFESRWKSVSNPKKDACTAGKGSKSKKQNKFIQAALMKDGMVKSKLKDACSASRKGSKKSKKLAEVVNVRKDDVESEEDACPARKRPRKSMSSSTIVVTAFDQSTLKSIVNEDDKKVVTADHQKLRKTRADCRSMKSSFSKSIVHEDDKRFVSNVADEKLERLGEEEIKRCGRNMSYEIVCNGFPLKRLGFFLKPEYAYEEDEDEIEEAAYFNEDCKSMKRSILKSIIREDNKKVVKANLNELSNVVDQKVQRLEEDEIRHRGRNMSYEIVCLGLPLKKLGLFLKPEYTTYGEDEDKVEEEVQFDEDLEEIDILN